jgi:hypothetical protein
MDEQQVEILRKKKIESFPIAQENHKLKPNNACESLEKEKKRKK